MLGLAVAICLAAMLGGTYLSFWIDRAPAPTIVLLMTVIFLAALTYKTQRVKRASASHCALPYCAFGMASPTVMSYHLNK